MWVSSSLPCFARCRRLAVTQEKLFPLLEQLLKDHEYVVRQHLAQQVWGLAQLCVEAGSVAGYSAIVEQLLPVLAKLVSDPTPDVRLASGESLIEVAKHLKPSDLGPRVLTFVLELAHDDREEELRMTAVRSAAAASGLACDDLGLPSHRRLCCSTN